MQYMAPRSSRCILAGFVFGAIAGFLCPGSLRADTTVQGSGGISVTVTPAGSYNVNVSGLGWQIGGEIGQRLSNLASNSGTDGIGTYQEIAFDYTLGSSQHGAIRAYSNRNAVLFTQVYNGVTANTAPFPALSRYPMNLQHISYAGSFAIVSFPGFGSDSPWTFFDSSANTFIVSPASNFMTASTSWGTNQQIVSGISPSIATLPQGFTQRTMLVIERGINRAFDTWGQAMTDLQGKVRPSNDAGAILSKLGYWTDNGAAYYYTTDPAMTYEGTLSAVKAGFDQAGIAVGYIQLDSWFYPKGPNADWRDGSDGIYNYDGAAALFAPSLRGFEQSLGVPLVTHSRWIDPSSPYRQQYTVSGNVAIDPQYWSTVASRLANAGVATYEQDWLGDKAQPNFNLTDGDLFLDNMSSSLAQQGISMQYCMAAPRHFLQSSKYNNLTTIRTSEDRFDRPRWTKYLYTARLASALGIWPFTDVFMSSETDNLLMAVLSAGPVGIGDPLDGLNVPNLLQAVRTDGVIVKPDVPLTPIDSSFFTHSNDMTGPMAAATYTDFGGLRVEYAMLYSQGTGTLPPITYGDLGIATVSYVYDYFAGAGAVVNPADSVPPLPSGGRAYYIASPVGPSGMALLGDKGHFVSLGKKRITQLSDDGALNFSVAFAPGEASRTVHGYSPTQPYVAVAGNGSASLVSYDPITRRFTVVLSPGPDQSITVGIYR